MNTFYPEKGFTFRTITLVINTGLYTVSAKYKHFESKDTSYVNEVILKMLYSINHHWRIIKDEAEKENRRRCIYTVATALAL